MAFQPGRFIEHISRSYNPSAIADFEWQADQYASSFGASNMRNYFSFFLSKLPREQRIEALDQRAAAMGFNHALEEYADHIRVFGDKTARSGQFGSFGIPRASFVGETDVDSLVGRLAYAMPNVQIDEAAQGAARYTMPGKIYTDDFLRSQARHMATAAQGQKNFLEGASRLVLDVETSGLGDNANIWQISARLIGKDGKTSTVEDILLPKGMVGLFGKADSPVTFEQFYENLRGGKLEWTDDVTEGLGRLFGLADQADYIVGQNMSFDAGALERLISHYQKSSPEFSKSASQFLDLVKSDKLVDTMVMSKALLGDSIEVAGELASLGKFTPYSMENILMQTSFLEDLSTRLGAGFAMDDFVTESTLKAAGGHGGRAAILGRIKAGMHLGDVDTWFEDQLALMQGDVLSGRNENLLRALGKEGFTPGSEWGSETWWGGSGGLRGALHGASAITPTTRLGEIGGITPIQNLVNQTRRFNTGEVFMGQLGEEGVLDSRFFKAGIYDEFMKKTLRKDGSVRHGVTLTEPDFARISGLHTAADIVETVQEKAMRANLPYAGISSIERLFTSMLGSAGNKDIEALTGVRRLVGDVVGSAAVSMADQVKLYGDNKNLALPMNLISALERHEVIETQFSRAMSGLDVDAHRVSARWSPFSYGPGGNKDFALVADLFQTDEQWQGFISVLEEYRDDFGISEDMFQSIKKSKANIQRYGVQLGIVGGAEDSMIQRAFALAEQYGFTSDKSDMTLRTTLLGPTGKMRESIKGALDNMGFTGATLIDDGSVFVDHAEAITRENQLTRSMLESSTVDIPKNRLQALGIEASRQFGEQSMPMYRFLERNLEHMPRRAGYAGAGLAAYYMFRKSRSKSEYDATFDVAGYEGDTFYEDYKTEMGERAPSNYMQLHQERRQMEALATAGTVGQLDRNKIGHHAMGPNKHNHLFGG